MNLDLKIGDENKENYTAIVNTNSNDVTSIGYRTYSINFTDYSKAYIFDGNKSVAITSGYNSTSISSGNKVVSISMGKKSNAIVNGNGIAIAMGKYSNVKTGELGGFVLPVYEKNGKIIRIISAMIGEKIDEIVIKPNTVYAIIEGKLKEILK